MSRNTQRIALTLFLSEISYIDEIANTLRGTRSQVVRVMVEAFKRSQSKISSSRTAADTSSGSAVVDQGAAREHVPVAAPTSHLHKDL